MKPSIICFKILGLSLLLCSTSLQAQLVYNLTSNTTIGSNGVNAGSGPTLVDNMDGTFDFSSAPGSGNSNAVYLDSSDGGVLSTLLGRALTANDIVTIAGTVDAFITPDPPGLVGNGIELGFQGAPGFRQTPNWLLQVDNDGIRGGGAPFFGGGGNVNRADTPGVVETSLFDGFSFEAIYDVNGITFNLSDIITANEMGAEPVGATSFSYTYSSAFFAADPLISYDFINDIGNGIAYFSHQTSAGGTSETAVLSNFSVEVSQIPEPSSLALISLFATCALTRRRK